MLWPCGLLILIILQTVPALRDCCVVVKDSYLRNLRRLRRQRRESIEISSHQATRTSAKGSGRRFHGPGYHRYGTSKAFNDLISGRGQIRPVERHEELSVAPAAAHQQACSSGTWDPECKADCQSILPRLTRGGLREEFSLLRVTPLAG